MKKLLQIDNCMDCTDSFANNNGLFCHALEKYVGSTFPYEIPADCPLPDAEDGG